MNLLLRCAICLLLMPRILLAQASPSWKVALAVCLTGKCAAHGEYSRQGAELAANELNAKGGVLGRRVALVVEDTDEASAGAKAVSAYRKLRTDPAIGGTIVAKEEPLPDATNLSAEALRIVSAKPEVIFFATMLVQGLASREVARLGYQGLRMASYIDAQRIEDAAGTLEGTLSLGFAHPTAQFEALFKSRYGGVPELPAAVAYDTMMLYARAIQEAHSFDAGKVKKTMLAVRFDGASGPIELDKDGCAVRETVGWVVRRGKLVPLAAEAARPQVKIGVVAELTGPGAPISDDCRRGIEAGRDALRAVYPVDAISLVYGDSLDDAKTGVSEFRKLVEIDRIWAAAVLRSKIALPINPISRQWRVPIVAGVGHPRLLSDNPYALRVFPSTELEGPLLARTAFGLGKRRAAVVTIEDEWNLALTSSFVRTFRALGGKIVREQALAPAETELAAIAVNIKRAAPDVIFVNLQFAQMGPLIKRVREMGVGAQLLSTYWIQKPEVVDVAGARAVEGALFAQVNTDRPKYLRHFKARYPQFEVTPAAYLCYVMLAALAEPLRDAPGDLGVEAYRQALLGVKEVRLADETIAFNAGEARLDLVVRAMRSGKAESFQTAGR